LTTRRANVAISGSCVTISTVKPCSVFSRVSSSSLDAARGGMGLGTAQAAIEQRQLDVFLRAGARQQAGRAGRVSDRGRGRGMVRKRLSVVAVFPPCWVLAASSS
jgi:hypothetical protein